MSPRNEVFEAIPFDASSDAIEPLIATGVAEEDHQLEEMAFSRLKFYSLLVGLLVGYFIQFSILGTIFLVIAIWGEDVASKAKTATLVFRIFWSFLTTAIAVGILGFIRNLITIAYSAGGGRSKDFLQDMVAHMEYRFMVGALVGLCLAWTMTDVILGRWAHIAYSLVILVVALCWCKLMMTCFVKDNKPPSSRRLTAEPTMIAV
jgi:hypothetical protein